MSIHDEPEEDDFDDADPVENGNSEFDDPEQFDDLDFEEDEDEDEE